MHVYALFSSFYMVKSKRIAQLFNNVMSQIAKERLLTTRGNIDYAESR